MKIINYYDDDRYIDYVIQGLNLALKIAENIRNHNDFFKIFKIKRDKYPIYIGGANPTLKPYVSVSYFEKPSYYNIYNLIHTIPIYLTKQGIIQQGENDISDFFGMYSTDKDNPHNPHIEIYVNNIVSSYSSRLANDQAFDNKVMNKIKWSIAFALLMKLAHAALDINNFSSFSNETKRIQYQTDFDKIRDFAMAYVIVKRLVKDYERHYQDELEFRQHIQNMQKHLPYECTLYSRLEELFSDQDIEYFLVSKFKGVFLRHQSEWLKYIQNNPSAEGLRDWNEILAYQYATYLYNGNYYMGGERIGSHKLALRVIKDYIDSHQNKVSSSEICEIFWDFKKPYFKHSKSPSIAPIESVIGLKHYDTKEEDILHFTDGDYVIYYYWSSLELNRLRGICSNLGIRIDRID